jgi:hypothetical protein
MIRKRNDFSGDPENGTPVRTLGRVLAVLMLACIPVSLFYAARVVYAPSLGIRTVNGSLRVFIVRDTPGVSVGDLVDARGLTFGERVRLISFPVWKPFSVRVVHEGHEVVVPLRRVSRPWTPHSFVTVIASQFVALLSLILAAIVLWRRPEPLAIAFGAYALGTLYALPTAQLFGFLPDPLFSVVAVVVVVLVATIPQLAIVDFALRFPTPLHGRSGRQTMIAIEAVLVALAIFGTVRWIVVPTIGDASDPLLDTAPALLTAVALVAIVLVRYARARGDDRRRLSWVAVGSIASAIGIVVTNSYIERVIDLPLWAFATSIVVQAALPIAFAYAILRHRVLDLGFAINRTVVYAFITATLVVCVSAVDWISGKLLSGTHLSAIVEAVATISFGVALSWFHSRVERIVDRVLFRRRYVALKRIEGRIAALGFATTTESVDEALVSEVVGVLHLESAAIFRKSSDATLVRTADHGWHAATRDLSIDHLLVRRLQAQEHTIELKDEGIADAAFPHGSASPIVAIPIVVRHDFLGFAIYGHPKDDTRLEPETVEQLERLVRAAAMAYDAIDAAEWRRRALALERATA